MESYEVEIDDGIRRKASTNILHATAMGEPVYRRLGFEKLCTTTQWLAKAPELSPAR